MEWRSSGPWELLRVDDGVAWGAAPSMAVFAGKYIATARTALYRCVRSYRFLVEAAWTSFKPNKNTLVRRHLTRRTILKRRRHESLLTRPSS
jgi:hypothetical protein